MSESRLFKSVKLGSIELKNRIAMSPLTRFRADDSHVVLPFVQDYYGQRASVPGTLLVTEGTIISQRHGGAANVPGIYNQDQINAWKQVTDEVHKKGSFIYLQLWALGRTANKDFAAANGFETKSSSATQLDDDHAVPKAMTIEEIQDTVKTYAQAAKNAIAAGFDGVEIHGANGYLIDQFLQDKVNKRTDVYGGSVENRSRFAFEVTQAVVEAVGADRTGIRFAPFSEFQGMKMADPIPQFIDILTKIDALGLSYVHFVDSRASGVINVENPESLAPLLAHYKGAVMIAGGFDATSAPKLLDEEFKDRDVVVVFGRYFISTPDLVFRLQKGIAFNPYDRSTFYKAKSTEGYIDYPFSPEFLTTQP